MNQVTSVVPGARVASYPSTQNPAFLSADQRTTFALVYPPPTPGPEPYAAARPALEAAVAQAEVAGAPLRLTGVDVLETASGGGDRGVLIEVILGGAGAFVVLVLVFSSLLAAVPLLIAAVSILTTFLCLLGLTVISEVAFVVQFLAALIGLGVAIDYALLIVMRWREERARGAANIAAVHTAMDTAGRSVIFSGSTVAVSLAALILFLAFVALSTVPEIEVKILATALALGIAIDALVVRAVLTPAVVTLLGRASWWMPPWAARPLRLTTPSSAPDRHRTPDMVAPSPGPVGAPPTPGVDGGVIVGEVSHGDRRPARAVLTLIDMQGRQIGRVRTDSAGGYRLRFSARGIYLLVCAPDPGTGCGPAAKRVTVVDGPVTCDVRLEAKPAPQHP